MEYNTNKIETALDIVFYLMYSKQLYENVKFGDDYYIRCYHINDNKGVCFKDHHFKYKDSILCDIMTMHCYESKIFTYYIRVYHAGLRDTVLRSLIECIEKGIDKLKIEFTLYKKYAIDFGIGYVEQEETI